MPMLALPILAALCLASCTDEEGADRAAEAARTITFAAAVAQPKDGNADADAADTRSTIEGTFAQGDLIGVGIAGEIKPYRYAADGRFVPDEADNGHYWQGNSQEEEAEIIAYYPYNNGELQYLQPQDQSSPEKLAAADILTARTQMKRGEPQITFTHLPARIVINLRAGRNMDDAALKSAVLTLPEVALQKVTIDPATGSITPEGVPAQNGIIPCERATPKQGYSRTVEALCSSQTYAAGTELFRIVVAGKTYHYHLPDNKTLSQNTRYTYNVTVNDADITVTTTGDDIPWENTEALPDGYDLAIANEEQLRHFAEAVNSQGTINGKSAIKAIVLQTADIELTKKWTPIGNNESGYIFEGKYNGNGHIIKNMTIKEAPFSSTTPCTGLFGSVENAVLTGINLQNVTIDTNAGDYQSGITSGAITGIAVNSTISLCSAEGKMIVQEESRSISAGGIAGVCNGSTISRCRAKVEILATTTQSYEIHAGEIIGNNIYGFILSCEAQGSNITTEGGNDVSIGGIAGKNNGTIAFCHAGNSNLEAKIAPSHNHVGGLVGKNNSHLYSCYAQGKATTPNGGNAGTLVGMNNPADQVQHCYGIGTDISNLPAVAGSIVYNTTPAPDEIFDLMQGYKGEVESFAYNNVTYYPTTTHYDPAAIPTYGIEPIRVKWTSAAWKMGIDPIYPEIDMLYEGIPTPDNGANN